MLLKLKPVQNDTLSTDSHKCNAAYSSFKFQISFFKKKIKVEVQCQHWIVKTRLMLVKSGKRFIQL